MKKLLLLFVFLIPYSSLLKAQEWFPVGAKWTYGYFSSIGPYYSEYPVTYRVVKDTSVLGKNCKQISDGSYRYYDSGLVFYYNPPQNTSWNLLFDFTKSVGDTIFYPQFPGGGDTLDYYNVVDSVFTVILNQDTLKGYTCWYDAFHFGSGPFGFKPIAIEIVSGGDLFYEFDYWPSGPIGLRCYEDSILGLFKVPGFTLDCDTSWTSGGVGLVNDLRSLLYIYPNPTRDHLNINVKDVNLQSLNLKIFDLNGNLQKQTEIVKEPQTLDVSNLKSGMYIYEIESEGRFHRDKLIIE